MDRLGERNPQSNIGVYSRRRQTNVLFSDGCDSVQITRREWIAGTGVLLSSACGRPKGTGYAGYALIATSGEDSVAVVDLTAFRLLKAIRLGAQPTAVLPAGSSGHSYVLTPATGSVHLIDGALQRTSSRQLADHLSEMRLTSDGKRLLAIAPNSHEVIEADAISLRVLRRHKLDAPAVDLDLAPAQYAAVSTGDHRTVELFHLETGQRWRAQMTGLTGTVRFRADGEVLLAANLQDRSLTALNVPSLEVIADLPLAMTPHNLCFNADQGQLFVSGEGMDGVAIVFPYNTLQVEQTVLAGRDPGVMACSAEPAYLFVGSHSGSDVCILDVDTRKVIGIVDIGEQPTYITTTPDSQYALVLDERAGDLAVIHIPAIRPNRQKTGASLFTMLPVGEKPVHAAVIPRTV
jgi:WD40 repeat protein